MARAAQMWHMASSFPLHLNSRLVLAREQERNKIQPNREAQLKLLICSALRLCSKSTSTCTADGWNVASKATPDAELGAFILYHTWPRFEMLMQLFRPDLHEQVLGGAGTTIISARHSCYYRFMKPLANSASTTINWNRPSKKTWNLVCLEFFVDVWVCWVFFPKPPLWSTT